MAIAEKNDAVPAIASEYAGLCQRPSTLMRALEMTALAQRAPVALILHESEDGLGLEPRKAIANVQGRPEQCEAADNHTTVPHAKFAGGPQRPAAAQGLLDELPARASDAESRESDKGCLTG